MGADAAGNLSRIFTESWRLLVHNPVIVVPGLIVGFLRTIAEWAVYPAPDASPLAKVADTMLRAVVQLLATVATVAFTTGIAAAAWRGGKGTLADGWTALRRDGGHVAVAVLALLLIGTSAAVLVPFTLGLSALAFAFFCLYVMPAAVAGERRGLAAVRESWALAYDRVLPTLGIALGLFVVFLAVGLFVAFLVLAPGIGALPAALAGALLAGMAIAYATLVIVGEYLAAVTPRSVA